MIRKRINSIAIVVAVTIGLSGCVNEALNTTAGGSLDHTQMAMVTLGSLSTTTTTTPQQGGESRATTPATAPLEVGKTFRLYAFPKGETDMGKLITTRTYTIKDVAGEPVLDSNQENLFLPVGDVDIFLVGPVLHDQNEGKVDANNNPLPPDVVEIASFFGVSPQYGVDLISSKTALTIKTGANQFQATPLVHRMAQVEVVVRQPDDAIYTDLNVTSISVMNQTLTGDFVFNASGGEITPADEGTETLLPTIRTIVPGKEFRGTMYVIPRKKTQLRIGVFLTCSLSGSEVDRRMESGIMTESLVAGQMNRFITKPYLSDKLIFRLRLMPWDDVSMDGIDVPALDGVLFSYSGLDAPRLIDGKMCVPDRSGNNRHGELVGDIRYNAEGKYYYAATKEAYIKVPDLGRVPVYTLELTAASKRDARSKIAQFKGETLTMSAYLPYTSNIIWFYAGGDADDKFNNNNSDGNDINFMEHLAVYAFTCDTNKMLSIRRNGVTLATKQGLNPNQQMTDNRLLSWSDDAAKGTEVKMYAARMTAKVDDTVIKNNYRNDIANFVGVTVDKEYSKRDYIEDGLILDLRGTNNYISVNGRSAWIDVSRAKNHAVVMSATVPQKGTDYYIFNGSQYLQLLHTLGALQNFTVEIVAKLGSGNQHTLLNFGNKPEGGDRSRQFSLHFPYNYIQCYSPYMSFSLAMPDDGTLPYTYTYMRSQPSQWSIARYNDRGKSFLEAWLNGGFAKSNSMNEILLKELRYCFIGFNGISPTQYYNSSVYAIRVYNRVLTELERQHNYQTDKVKYNLVP